MYFYLPAVVLNPDEPDDCVAIEAWLLYTEEAKGRLPMDGFCTTGTSISPHRTDRMYTSFGVSMDGTTAAWSASSNCEINMQS